MIFVTHDQVEAMTLADRIVVLRAGVVEQVGTPLELYNTPANLFVAGFIGSPRMNFLAGEITGSGNGTIDLKLDTGLALTMPVVGEPPATGGKITFGVRPEDITVATPDTARLSGEVQIAEHLGGTESNFAKMMTAKARALGMSHTTFRNASGLPDSRQVTTARDMATLGIALQEHFPEQFRYFATPSFKLGNVTMRNHNRLLGRVRGVDGIKTGYTRASGFNLVTSVHTGGRSIVAVVMGGKTGSSRDAHMQELLAATVSKGSKRKRGGMLIARAGGTHFDVDEVSVAELAPRDVPVPAFADRPVDAPAPVAAAAAVTNLVAAEPTPRPEEPVDNIQTASTPVRSGWVIQIASLPTQDEAVEYLRDAQDRAGPVLGARDPFVEEFEKGGVVYHRARFAGFDSKSAAWSACKALKKYNYSCLAFDNS